MLGLDHSNPNLPPSYLPIDEAHPPRPTDAYGLSKLCGERIAEAYSRRGVEVIVIRPCFVAFPDMADFMAGKPGPEGRSEPMPYLRTYVGPEDCARGFAAAATVEYAGFETFFLAADDAFATEPTVGRLEALYGTPDPAARCHAVSAASLCVADQQRGGEVPARVDADDTLDGRRDQRLTVPIARGERSMSLTNQVALVTGAGQGIGKASALALAEAGAHVVVADIDRQKAEATADAIMSMQRRALAVQADVGDLQHIDRMVREALQQFGQIDILLNNAGVTRRADIMELTEADWDRIHRVNAKGVFFCLQRVAQEMIPRRSGRIINIASIAGKGYEGTSNAAYAASKGAVIA